ncbi:MAG: hypothetical protein CMJ16_07705 [Peredibacter sp.]|nr:hypothetical protein [Peredibacter sp.]
MSIPSKDQRILLGRSAGRCSIGKAKLTVDASNKSGATIFGEMCHIVGEKKKSARFESPMEIEDRNRYHNLILLCRNHHKIIDDNEESYPIEKLHQIKADHELWVEEKLIDKDSENKFYNDLLEFTVLNLQLEYWDFHSDELLRGLYRVDLSENITNYCKKMHRIVWTRKIPELEEAFENLFIRISQFHEVFHSNSRLRPNNKGGSSDIYQEDFSYKTDGLEYTPYSEAAEKAKQWKDKYIKCLFNCVVALNEWAEIVRKTIKPDFFLSQGKFIIDDQLGYTNGSKSVIYTPESYIDIE